MKDEKALSEIRKIAYGLWVQEGRPDGQDRRHWDVAKEIWAFRHSGEDAPATPEDRRDDKSGMPGVRKTGRAGTGDTQGSRRRSQA